MVPTDLSTRPVVDGPCTVTLARVIVLSAIDRRAIGAGVVTV
jgi:hypothetical protein